MTGVWLNHKAMDADSRRQAGVRRALRNRVGNRVGSGALWAAATILLGGFVVLAVTIYGGFRKAPPLLKQIDQLAARVGLGLETVSLTGFDATDDRDIFAALELEKFQTLLGFDARRARQRLKVLPWVRDVRIKQAFPSRLEVIIKERQPYAVWDSPDGEILVDREGRQLMIVRSRAIRHLPVIAGHGAPQTAAALFSQLVKYPELSPLKVRAIRVSDRRWTLILPGNRHVLLPEKHAEQALARLMSGQQGQRLIDRDFAVLDLRVAGQMVVRPQRATVRVQKSSFMLKPRLQGSMRG